MKENDFDNCEVDQDICIDMIQDYELREDFLDEKLVQEDDEGFDSYSTFDSSATRNDDDEDFYSIFDSSQDPATRKLIHLTPEMIKMFRQGEIYRLEAKREHEKEETEEAMKKKISDESLSDTSSSYIVELKSIIDQNFEKGELERTPKLWPVLSMRF